MGVADAHTNLSIVEKEYKKKDPSTLLHYTSWGAFLGMLKPILDSHGECQDITMHASHISAMDDRTEGKLILDTFFTGSNISNKIKEKFLDYKKRYGDSYVVSFCSSRDKEENLISMWRDYADGGKGVCLHIAKKLLEEDLKRKGIPLMKCDYLTKEKIRNRAKELRDIIKDEMNKSEDISEEFKKLLFTASTTKERYWDYEEEYRMIIFKTNPRYKTNKLGIVPYQEINIPISVIEKITIGPMATQDIEEHCLHLLRDTLEINPNTLKIRSSKLKLQ